MTKRWGPSTRSGQPDLKRAASKQKRTKSRDELEDEAFDAVMRTEAAARAYWGKVVAASCAKNKKDGR